MCTFVCGSIISEAGTYELFVYDIDADAIRRLPVQGDAVNPIWMPDGRAVVYGNINSVAAERLVLRRVDGGDAGATLFQAKERGEYVCPCSVGPDGKWVLGREVARDRQHPRLIAVSTGEPPEVRPLFDGEGDIGEASLSPDGRWIAAVMLDGGRTRIVVRANPVAADAPARAGVSATVTAQNGHGPIWSPDGTTLCFAEGRARIRAVDIRTEPALSISQPRDLFDWDTIGSASDYPGFTPDGKHMVFVLASEEEARTTRINFVLNWGQELRAKLGSR